MVSVVGAVGIIIPSLTINNTGNVKTINLDAYWNANQTSPVSSLMWGSLWAGQSRTHSFYVYNSGNTAETLAMTTLGWSSTAAQNGIAVTWDAQGATLGAESNLLVTVTLMVKSSASGFTNYSFTIMLAGEGVGS